MYSIQPNSFGNRQQGAALVVGLLLLLVITLLAISGINSSSLQLVMASNTQGYQDAFQSAAGAIEEKIINKDLFVENQPEDSTISVRCNAMGEVVQDPPYGTNASKAGAMYFDVREEGTSVRGVAVNLEQGVLRVVPADDDSFGPIGGLATNEQCSNQGGVAGNTNEGGDGGSEDDGSAIT